MTACHAAYKLDQLSKLIFPPSSKRRALAVIAAYLDGAGTDDKSKYVVVAGFVASANQWVEFEKEWAKLLADYGLPFAHARKLLGQLGKERRNTFYLQAHHILRDMNCFAVAATVKKADYEAVFGKGYPLTVKDAIYPLAFRVAMVTICRYMPEVFPGEKVALLVESGDPNQGGAREIFNATLTESFGDMKEQWPLESLTFVNSKRDFGALQVADMHCYGKLKQQESKFRLRPNNSSHELLAMLLGPINTSHYDVKRDEIRRHRTLLVDRHNRRKRWGKQKTKKT